MDFLRSFLIDSSDIRGKIIRSSQQLSEAVTRHQYPPLIAKILFESMMIVNLFANDLKKDGIITIQMEGNPDILKFMVVDATDRLDIRGYCELNPDISSTDELNFTDIFKFGKLIVTIDLGEGYERYQGITVIEGNDISEVISNFIINSEQLPTIIKVASQFDEEKLTWVGSGLMIQYMPGHQKIKLYDIPENWQEIEIFSNTLTDDELLDFDTEEQALLKKLYNEHDVVLFDKKPITNKCRCSHLRAMKVLKSLSEEELEDLKVDGKIMVKCQFCLKESEFTDI